MMMKIFESQLCKGLPLVYMALLDMVEDQIDQSLDLMNENDSWPLKDRTLTVMDFSEH